MVVLDENRLKQAKIVALSTSTDDSERIIDNVVLTGLGVNTYAGVFWVGERSTCAVRDALVLANAIVQSPHSGPYVRGLTVLTVAYVTVNYVCAHGVS